MAIRKKITAGAVTFVTVMSERRKKIQKRRPKTNPTRDDVMKVNRKNAYRDLSIKLNHNFREGDLHVTLTYRDEPSKEQAKKDLSRFKRKLNGCKWIVVTEYENKRIHHHMVISGKDLHEIQKLWSHGLIKCTVLDSSGDYRDLAAYLIKETDKSFRTQGAVSRRRYNCSRSIENPNVYVEEVGRLDPYDEPVVLKGTYLDEDSVFRGENPFTGERYMTYTLIALDPQKKRRLKGRKETYSRDSQYEKWLNDYDELLEGYQLELTYL